MQYDKAHTTISHYAIHLRRDREHLAAGLLVDLGGGGLEVQGYNLQQYDMLCDAMLHYSILYYTIIL